MSMIRLTIDGREAEGPLGSTILEIARGAGVGRVRFARVDDSPLRAKRGGRAELCHLVSAR